MKSILFLVLLVGIVVLALYLKKRSDTKATNPQFDYDETPVITQWDTILTGKWQIYSLLQNSEEKWEVDSEIEFLGEKGFRLHATEDYYILTSFSGEPALEMRCGGGVSGKWYAKSDSSFTLLSQNCDFSISKGKGTWSEKVRALTCKNGSVK